MINSALQPALYRDATAPQTVQHNQDVFFGEPMVFTSHRQRPDAEAAADREDLRAHVRRLGLRPSALGSNGDRLIATLAEISLTGRGGAHFPVAEKWRAVRMSGQPAVLVVNAAESEPASAKDRALLSRRPHLVLDGVVCAAEAVGAQSVTVWTHRGDRAHRSLVAAIEERANAGLQEPPIRVVSAPNRYLSGESGAIVSGLSGGPVLPQFRTTPTAVSGVHGQPTLVHNVETLARVGLVARTGAAGYQPTTLLTVVSESRLTVIEADENWTVADAVYLGGWGSPHGPQAVLLGGYGGSWLPWSVAAGLPIHEPAVRAAGASLGAGIIAPLPETACPVIETATVARYLANSGARQCGPCLFGLPAIATLVESLATGQASRGDLARLRSHLPEVHGRGGCRHPDGAVRFVASALSTFAEHVEAHVNGQLCRPQVGRGVLPIPMEG